MVGKQHVGPAGDPEAISNVDTHLLQLLDFVHQFTQVHHHSRSDQTSSILMENAGGYEVKNEFLAVHDNRVTSVIPPLISNNPIRFSSKSIRQFSFAFVSPLCSNNCGCLIHDYSNSERKSIPRLKLVSFSIFVNDTTLGIRIRFIKNNRNRKLIP